MSCVACAVVVVSSLMLGAPPRAVFDEDDPPSQGEPLRDDVDSTRRFPRRQAPASEDTGLLGYLRLGTSSDEMALAPPVREDKPLVWLTSALLAPLGAFVWVPRLAFSDAPENGAASTALLLGLTATAVTWSMVPGSLFMALTLAAATAFPPLFLVALMLDVAWLLALAVANFYVVPRAILRAYSDAYGGPEGRAPAPSKRIRRRPRVVTDEDK